MTIITDEDVKCLILGRDLLMKILGDNVKIYEIKGISYNLYKSIKMGIGET